MTNKYLYDLDLSGTQPGNLIKNEKHVVVKPTQITQASFVVLRACPFYSETIVVKDAKGSNARILNKGQDYILTHQSIALTRLTRQPVYASITLIDRNYTGDIYIDYQTVGGEYVPDDYTIVEKLTREKFVLHKTTFDQIVGLPSSYPNPVHQHDPRDMVGLAEVVAGLQDLSAAIRSIQGSYGALNTIVEGHIKSTLSHTPSQVGLSLVRNYDTAIIPDLDNRATDKYLTPIVVADWVNGKLTQAKNEGLSTYLSKVDAESRYLNKEASYTKGEISNLVFDKAYVNANYLKISDALTINQVGNIVNQIVDMSQYHTRNEAYSLFYTKDQADTRFYTKSQADAKFITESSGDSRYIQTTNANTIISEVYDNGITLRNGKFYTGKYADESVVNLYIDCINGSDNNPGTRSNPLQTLKRANEITPKNKSSTWYLRHYTLDQMVRAASRYAWDFSTEVTDEAVRYITVYGHTWIDGAKASQVKQTGNGQFDWRYVNEVERLPVYIGLNVDTNAKTQRIYQLSLSNGARVDIGGIALMKPMSVGPDYHASNPWQDISFFKGEGEIAFSGCYLLSLGEYSDKASSHYYSWFMSDLFEDMNILYNGSAFGFATEQINNGVSSFKTDFNGIFNFAGSNCPFKYYNSRGSIFAIDGIVPAPAAAMNGATAIVNNMRTVLQRPNMFYGLNFVNGVCTNILTNLAFNPN